MQGAVTGRSWPCWVWPGTGDFHDEVASDLSWEGLVGINEANGKGSPGSHLNVFGGL